MSVDLGQIVSTVSVGLAPTVEAALGGIAIAAVLSFVAGLGLLSRHRWVRFLFRIYVEGLRGSSEVVQLFFLYFVVPAAVGFKLVPLFAGILVLGLNHGAYGAEIVRGAVQSVPKAQIEGAVALNLTPAQRMRRVVLPQAVVEMLPSFNNLFIQLLKSTALLSFITVPDLAHQGELLRPVMGQSGTPVIYLFELVLYLVLALLVTAVMRWLERITARRIGRRPPDRATALGKALPGSV